VSESKPRPLFYDLILARKASASFDEIEERAEVADRYEAFAEAVDWFYSVLKTYPQTGEPLDDLVVEGKPYTTRVLSNRTLSFTYVIDEEARRVIVHAPIKVMPGAGF
jgi:hypothetical protein